MFLTNKTTIIAKLEATPYNTSGESLADADFSVRIKNDVSYSLEIDEYRRKILDATLDHLLSVPGKQRGTVSFTVDMAPGAAVDTPPAYAKLLQACGFKETIFATFGVSYVPHVDVTHTPLTLEIHEQLEGASADHLVTRFQGCMGNVSFIIGTVGEPVQMQFEFSGVFISMTDLAFASKIDPTSLSVIKPGSVLASTINVNSVAQDLDSFEINMNNDIQEWVDPSRAQGVKGFYRAMFEPTMTMNPTLKQLATEPVYTEWNACTGLATSILVPNGTDPDITITSPVAQRTGLAIGDRNGARTADTTFLLTKGSAGNDVFEILQGAKS